MSTPTVYSCYRKSFTIDDKLNWLYYELEKLKEQGGGDYDEKIAELQRQINDLRASVVNLVSTTTQMGTDIDTLTQTTDNHSSQIGALDRTTREINNEVTAINAALGSVDDDLQRIETTVGNLSREVTELRTNLSSLSDSLDATQSTVDGLTDTVSQHRADIDNIDAQVRINSDAIATINGAIFEVSQVVDFEIPLITEDIANTSIPSLTINLTTEQAARYKAVSLGKFEVMDATGNSINCCPVRVWTQSQQKQIRVRFMACGTTRRRAAIINCTVICSVR